MHKTYFILLITVSGFLLSEYKNTNGVASEKSFADMLKWIRSDIEPEISKIELSSEWQKLNLSQDDNYAVWIGHSTFLIKKNGVTILTDPIFSERASPFKNIGPKRLIPPAGGINLFGPMFLNGDALSEKIGSVRMVTPFFLIKKVE